MQKTKGIFGSFVCGAGTLDGVFQVFFAENLVGVPTALS